MNSIETKDRIDILDYLRGFALLGIILINIVFLLSAQTPSPDTLDAAYWKFLYLFVEGRFYTIFSFLFGIGFHLFISRAHSKGKNGTILFLRRILVMFLFGLVHYSFHPGEALTVYAVSGLLVLPFYKLKKELNLTIGLLLLLLFGLLAIKPFLPVALILLGLTAGQYRLFEDLTAKKRRIRWCTGILFLSTIVVLVYQNNQAPSLNAEGTVEMYWFYHIGIMVGPIVSAFYVSLFVLLTQVPVIQKLLLPLKYYGRMALTNYILQTAFILFAGYGLGLFGKITYLQSLFICLAVYAIQLVYSIWWLRFFRFGPLEWIWRALTYLKMPPLRLPKPEDN